MTRDELRLWRRGGASRGGVKSDGATWRTCDGASACGAGERKPETGDRMRFAQDWKGGTLVIKCTFGVFGAGDALRAVTSDK
ncbi:hypothetical protein CR161_02705 [Prosthecochloris sp. ZM]|nr:hypothetical protein CR161_02705 [Prosthecochloris sp. ZM]